MELRGLADATTVYAELVVALGDYLDGASLVLPDNERFPDTVTATPAGVRTLFERVLTYTPVRSDTDFALQLRSPDDDEACNLGKRQHQKECRQDGKTHFNRPGLCRAPLWGRRRCHRPFESSV